TSGNLRCHVDSIGVVGGLRHLTCGCGQFSPTLLSREPYNVGDTVAFEVTRYNLYRDGRLVER
ncbi:MAG: ABC transporter ATP-binding protein, partial [Nitrososphaeria archaeon]